jgi:hypothetical protein
MRPDVSGSVNTVDLDSGSYIASGIHKINAGQMDLPGTGPAH